MNKLFGNHGVCSVRPREPVPKRGYGGQVPSTIEISPMMFLGARLVANFLIFGLLLCLRAANIHGWVPLTGDRPPTTRRDAGGSDVQRKTSRKSEASIIAETNGGTTGLWKRIFTMTVMTAKMASVDSEDAPSMFSVPTVSIRECLYGDLGECADVIMSAFYPNYNSPWKHLTRIAELDRIQQTFSYDKNKHMMYLAIVDEAIVGFVDIDLRPPNRPMPYTYNPRPYISDLCVHADYQRRGIACDLIARCEEFCKTNGREMVYIRVQSDNTAAVGLYKHLGYVEIDNPDCSDGSILILMKQLNRSRDDEVEAGSLISSIQDDSCQNEDEDYVI